MEIPPNLKERQLRGELMDDPALDAGIHRQALAGLRRVNTLSRATAVLWKYIKPELNARPLILLDLATGGGDVLAAIARRAGNHLECHGVDISNVALAEARRLVPGNVALHQADLTSGQPWPGPPHPDIIVCSLFIHHLSDQNALRLLTLARARARRLVLVNDLNRSRLSWWAVWAGTRLLTPSPIVREDGVRSIEAAFQPAELRRIAEQAGLRGAVVRTEFPCRLVLAWRRQRNGE